MSQKPRAIEIEQQLAQLRWRRIQNERSIRNYLETTKVMKQKDTILGLSIDQSAEKIDWLDGVVRDELSRPLVLNDHELHNVEFEEHKVKQRLIKYSEQQLDSLNRLIDETATRDMRTKDGKRIKAEQLQRFNGVREQLERNLTELQQRTPYVNVKYAVTKMF